jgi:hypothetical protein
LDLYLAIGAARDHAAEDGSGGKKPEWHRGMNSTLNIVQTKIFSIEKTFISIKHIKK